MTLTLNAIAVYLSIQILNLAFSSYQILFAMFLISFKSFSKLDRNLHQKSPLHFHSLLIQWISHSNHTTILHSSFYLFLFCGLLGPNIKIYRKCPSFFFKRLESKLSISTLFSPNAFISSSYFSFYVTHTLYYFTNRTTVSNDLC